MNTQYRKKIRVITLHESFFELFSDGSDPEMLLIKEEMHRRPCLILVKLKYRKNKYTFAIPFRSNIHRSCPKYTFFALPPRTTTKPGNYHGLHYIKAFPVDQKYILPYHMGGDFLEEYVMANVEKNIKTIIHEFETYLKEYENGKRPLYCIDIDNCMVKLNLIK